MLFKSQKVLIDQQAADIRAKLVSCLLDAGQTSPSKDKFELLATLRIRPPTARLADEGAIDIHLMGGELEICVENGQLDHRSLNKDYDLTPENLVVLNQRNLVRSTSAKKETRSRNRSLTPKVSNGGGSISGAFSAKKINDQQTKTENESEINSEIIRPIITTYLYNDSIIIRFEFPDTYDGLSYSKFLDDRVCSVSFLDDHQELKIVGYFRVAARHVKLGQGVGCFADLENLSNNKRWFIQRLLAKLVESRWEVCDFVVHRGLNDGELNNG